MLASRAGAVTGHTRRAPKVMEDEKISPPYPVSVVAEQPHEPRRILNQIRQIILTRRGRIMEQQRRLDEKEIRADARDIRADERDSRADKRDARADERDARMDAKEASFDERAAAKGSPDSPIRSVMKTMDSYGKAAERIVETPQRIEDFSGKAKQLWAMITATVGTTIIFAEKAAQVWERISGGDSGDGPFDPGC